MSEPTDASAPDSLSSDPDCWECGEYMCDEPSGPDEYPGSDYSEEPVRYSNGEIFLVAEDLAFKNLGVNWGHTRSYSNRVTEPGVGRNGNSWFVKEWPYLSPSELDTNTPTTICLIWVIQEALWFDYTAGSGYKARFFVRPKLQHDPAAHVFTLFDSEGRVTKFYDFTGPHAAARRGQFLSFTDAKGRETTAIYDPVEHRIVSFVQQGELPDNQTHTAGYHYNYGTDSSKPAIFGRLIEVCYKVDGEPVRRATYSYHDGGTEHGSAGDLETVTIAKWTGDAWEKIGCTYYRYWKAGDAEGVVHGLQYVVGPLGYATLERQSVTPETAFDHQIAQVARHEFRYNSDRSVRDESVNSGTASYGFVIAESNFDDDFNHWKRRTTETLPDGNRQVVYTNYAGQLILKVFIRMKGEVETNQHWYEFRRYDGDGRTILRAASSAVEIYDDTIAEPVTLKASQGLIHCRHYYPPDSTEEGSAPYRPWYETVQKGAGSDVTPIKLKEWRYVPQTIDGNTVYFPEREIVYREASGGGSSQVITRFSYDWAHFQVIERTTWLPIVSTGQNGPGDPVNPADQEHFIEAFDDFGRILWRRDERGYITGWSYAGVFETPTQQIEDVDETTDPPWDVLPGAHLHLVTDWLLDDQGRIVRSLGPKHYGIVSGSPIHLRRARWIVYHDGTKLDDPEGIQRWEADGFQRVPNETFTLINPVHLEFYDDAGRLVSSIDALRTDTTGPLDPDDEFPPTSWIRSTQNNYDGHANVASRIVFVYPPTEHTITRFQYDIRRRTVREQSPGGTITRYVYHPRGWVLSKWIGTIDVGGDDRNPAGSNPYPGGPNNMVKVEEYQYDGGASGRDGNLTKITQYAGFKGTPPVMETRVTTFSYDFRNRRTSANGEVDFHERYFYDNLDRVWRVNRRDTTSDGPLVARADTLYDDRGRVFRTLRYRVELNTNVADHPLAENIWFDPAGNVLKHQPAGAKAFNKFEYDGINRPVVYYLAHDFDETLFADAGSVADDIVVEQTETTYDPTGFVTVQVQRGCHHDATDPGSLKSPTGDPPNARVTFMANWPDALGRLVATANYGTNDGIPPDRTPQEAIPTPSNDILVTITDYNDRGEAWQITDPAGRKHRTEFDAVGRRRTYVQNYVDRGTAYDQNKTTHFEYTPDGLLWKLTAENVETDQPGTASGQITEWVYGTSLLTSGIASSLLVWKKVYPEAFAGDPNRTVVFKYNRLGQVVEMKDQRQTIHTYEYDTLGRLLHDKVPQLGNGGVDGTIRRISYTYNLLGLPATIGSYHTFLMTNAVKMNEVRNAYNGFGQIKTQVQARLDFPDATVGYEYAEGSDNTTRLKWMTYPNGRKLYSHYGAAGSTDDQLSRVAALIDNDQATHLVDYQYVGAGAFAIVAYPEPDITLTYEAQDGEFPTDDRDKYIGWDRFGRIVDQRWIDAGGTAVDRFQYGYDPASNPRWRRNVVADTAHDELYAYDGLDQLTRLERGTLDPGHNSIDNRTWLEAFTYDPTGNWMRYQAQATVGPALDQTRTHNKANQIVTIAGSTGLVAYDHAGNMAKTPEPGNWTAADEMIWDAWNRLMGVGNADSGTQFYAYDGLNRRLSTSDVAQCLYSDQWQVIEERSGGDAAERHFVWGQRRLDDLVARDRFLTSGVQRLFTLADRLSVTSIGNSTGSIQERYNYSAFGTPNVMGTAFDPIPASLHSWETRFGGYRWDEGAHLHQVRFRYLHSSTGRWLSRDPIAEEAGTNLYEIVANNPETETDPLGLFINTIGCVCKVKAGPAYKPPGPLTAAHIKGDQPGRRTATFEMFAEFEHDPKNKIHASCCEVRQFIKWTESIGVHHDSNSGFFGLKPNVWYEDRGRPDRPANQGRYGHRNAPGQEGDMYTTAEGKPDQRAGTKYSGRDSPSLGGNKVGTLSFKLCVVDVCKARDDKAPPKKKKAGPQQPAAGEDEKEPIAGACALLDVRFP